MPTPEEQIDAIVLHALDQLGDEIARGIQEEIQVAYPPASVAGEPPHRRTGNLANLISYTVGQFGSVYVLNVLSEASYSKYLEDGTDRMGARPFMVPALEKWTPIVISRLQDAFHSSGAAPPVNSAFGLIYPTANAA